MAYITYENNLHLNNHYDMENINVKIEWPKRSIKLESINKKKKNATSNISFYTWPTNFQAPESPKLSL